VSLQGGLGEWVELAGLRVFFDVSVPSCSVELSEPGKEFRELSARERADLILELIQPSHGDPSLNAQLIVSWKAAVSTGDCAGATTAAWKVPATPSGIAGIVKPSVAEPSGPVFAN
jgi:hypothetical protein